MTDQQLIAQLLGALKGIQRFGLDTLSGRADGPDNREWQREGINEMTKRARLAIEQAEAATNTGSERGLIHLEGIMIAENMFTPDQKALYDLMSDISEDCFFAAWIMGNEYGVWDAINGNARGYEQASVQQLEKCRELSKLINGWIIWRDDQDDPDMPIEEWGPYFIGMDEWIVQKHTYDEATIALFAKRSQ